MGMSIINAQDVAINLAKRDGSLRIDECVCSRLGNTYWAIRDSVGIIEVCLTWEEALKKCSVHVATIRDEVIEDGANVVKSHRVIGDKLVPETQNIGNDAWPLWPGGN